MRDPEACVFCRRIERNEFDDFRNQWAVTFEPLFPVTPGHRLVVPTHHFRSAMSNHRVTGDVMDFAVKVADYYEVGDCNFITSCGPAATQTIHHLHIHIVPRRDDDGLHLPWTGQAEREGRA